MAVMRNSKKEEFLKFGGTILEKQENFDKFLEILLYFSDFLGRLLKISFPQRLTSNKGRQRDFSGLNFFRICISKSLTTIYAHGLLSDIGLKCASLIIFEGTLNPNGGTEAKFPITPCFAWFCLGARPPMATGLLIGIFYT